MRKISKLLGIVSLFLASGGVYGLLFENIDIVSILAVLVWIGIGYGFLWLSGYNSNKKQEEIVVTKCKNGTIRTIASDDEIHKVVADIKVGGSNVIDLRKNG